MDLDECWDNVILAEKDEQGNVNKNITEEESEIKTFTVKNYIPKRFTKKFFDLPHIIGIAIIFILLITIIVLLSLKNKNVTSELRTNAIETQEITDNASAEIILLDGKRFWVYDPQKGSVKILLEVKNPTQAFVVDTKKTLFWIETKSWKIFSLHRSKSGKGQEVNLIFEGSRRKPLRKPTMALDSINNNLYIVDESIRGLVIINTETKYYALMLIDVVNPRYIVLDAAKGLMFISSTKWIKRADMDGNNLLTIVVNKAISAVTLDPEGEKIYWIHNSEVIESSDYNGQQEKYLLTDFTSVIDLTFLDGHLFWLRKSSGIQNKMIWSCIIKNGTCDNHTMHSNTVSTATFIKVTSRIQNNSRYQKFSNHQNCEHMSLATPNGQMSCVCNMSSQLVFNSKCEPITEFILYTFNGEIRARTLDISNKIILEPIWPTPYLIEPSLEEQLYVDFDYDFENDDFYFNDDKKIYKIKLKVKNPKQEVVLTINSDNFYIKDLAYDWLTENMYYLRLSKLTHVKHSLEVFNVKKGRLFQKTLTNFDAEFDYNLNHLSQFSIWDSSALAIYPSQEYILVLTAAQNDGGKRYISQCMINGTQITKDSTKTLAFTDRLIAVDYEKDRIYWISSEDTVIHINFDGTDYAEIRSVELSNVISISINRQWIYLSNREKVWRVNKETGSYDNLVSPLYNDASIIDSGAKVISQTQVKENPCRIKNGGCEQFCFYGPKPTCGCADGLLVTSEGRCK